MFMSWPSTYTVKTLRSGKYKGKLSGYAQDFANHKEELHKLLTAQSAMTIQDVKTDVGKVVALLESRSAKEQKLEQLLDSLGGFEAVMKVRCLMPEFQYILTPSAG